MKELVLVVICVTASALSQDKPRVFVQGKGSQDVTTSGGRWASNTTVDSHDEGMEVTKNLQKDCAGMVVTLNQSNADYTVILNRESKHNRGLLRTNSQIQVANRLGDIIGTNATRTVGNASKDACQLIVSDWGRHGKTVGSDSSASGPAASLPTTTLGSQPSSGIAAATATVASAGDGSVELADAKANTNGPDRPLSEATAEVSSEPSGADIEIDGSFVGSTPSSFGVVEGEHTLRISKEGYTPWERTLRISTGNIKISAVLALPAVPVQANNASSGVDQADRLPGSSVPAVAASNGIRSTDVSVSVVRGSQVSSNLAASVPEEALLGIWFRGNPTVRHDGVEIVGVKPQGPADNIDMKPGDVLLAIDDHYLFTIDEVRSELLRHNLSARLRIRYRRNQLISETYLTLGAKVAASRK